MLVARAFQVRGNAQKPRVHFNGLYSELTKSVVIKARIPGADGRVQRRPREAYLAHTVVRVFL